MAQVIGNPIEIVQDLAIQLLRADHVKKATVFLKTSPFFLGWKFLKFGGFLIQDIHLTLRVDLW
jgi:hypothetical protein